MMKSMKKVLNILLDICTTILAIVILLNLVIITLVSTGLTLILFTPIALIVITLTQLEKIVKCLIT